MVARRPPVWFWLGGFGLKPTRRRRGSGRTSSDERRQIRRLLRRPPPGPGLLRTKLRVSSISSSGFFEASLFAVFSIAKAALAGIIAIFFAKSLIEPVGRVANQSADVRESAPAQRPGPGRRGRGRGRLLRSSAVRRRRGCAGGSRRLPRYRGSQVFVGHQVVSPVLLRPARRAVNDWVGAFGKVGSIVAHCKSSFPDLNPADPRRSCPTKCESCTVRRALYRCSAHRNHYAPQEGLP